MKSLVKKTLYCCIAFVFGVCNTQGSAVENFYKQTREGGNVSLSVCKGAAMETIKKISTLLVKTCSSDTGEQISIDSDISKHTLLTADNIKNGQIAANIDVLQNIKTILAGESFSTNENVTIDKLKQVFQDVFTAYTTTEGEDFQEKCKEALERLNTLEEQRILTKEVTKNNSSSSVGVSTSVATEHKNNSTSSIKNLTE